MRTIVLAVIFMLLGTGFAFAGAIGLDFNNDSAEVRLSLPISEDNYGTTLFNSRYTYNSEEKTNLFSTAIAFYGEPGNVPGLSLGAGFIGYIGNTNKSLDTLNIGLEGEVEYMPAGLRGFGLGARFAFAPKVFSFMDSEGLIEASGRAFYAITPKVHVYLNYQYIVGEFESASSVKFDNDLRFGIRAFF